MTILEVMRRMIRLSAAVALVVLSVGPAVPIEAHQ
jgi:hypothetical protein